MFDRKLAMSLSNKLIKGVKKFNRQLWQVSRTITKSLMTWLLRGMMLRGRRNRATNAGFVLPTVTMVLLVVVLLTTAIVFRSFDRAKNASNIRVSETVLAAATPGIDRAKAKIAQVFKDPDVSKSKPSEEQLYQVMSKDKFTFGDEVHLTLGYDINKDGSVKEEPISDLGKDETLKTAWKFPIDTDNDGKFDSFTLYGVYFRTPPDTRANPNRTPIEARTTPMDEGASGGKCAQAAGTSASLADGSGWYTIGSKAKKSFLVYTVNIPITQADIDNLDPVYKDKDKYFLPYKGNQGFSALEYQQDWAQIPLDNNAVVYEDDLVITPGSGINLNGRVMTNSNLITGRQPGKSGTEGLIKYYQVSSPNSCFYKEENSKIVVGGNVVIGQPGNTQDFQPVEVHLFDKSASPTVVSLTKDNDSVNDSPSNVAYNSRTYAERINSLVNTWTTTKTGSLQGDGGFYHVDDPDEVAKAIKNNINPKDPQVRQKELESYFKDRTRRVPFKEDPFISTAQQQASFQGTKDTLRPQSEWVFPTDPNNGFSSSSYNKVLLSNTGNKIFPPATDPEKQKGLNKEPRLGDRIVVGNGLPAKWDVVSGKILGEDRKQLIKSAGDSVWDDGSGKKRYRMTQTTPLSDLGDTDRNGFWEESAARAPQQLLDGLGGMRVVTGAGIYVDDDGTQNAINPTYKRQDTLASKRDLTSFLPPPQWDLKYDPQGTAPTKLNLEKLKFQGEDPILVWPDTMPMRGGDEEINANPEKQNTGLDRKGDLLMRATAVYHYATDAVIGNQKRSDMKPIACVSSYYNPTNATTARNPEGLSDVSGGVDSDGDGKINFLANGLPAGTQPANGKSNNGVVYTPVDRGSFAGYLTQLKRQARLVYPNGRFANEPLRNALDKYANGGLTNFTMADYSAVDTALCAISILDGTATRNATVIPDGAIYETAFLDTREVKEIDQVRPTPGTEANYDVFVEDRQPLEVRATVLDLNLLRQKGIAITAPLPAKPEPEYLLPNSGIIYATRDDATLDLSNNSIDTATQKRLSSNDLVLDPTRRISGIMLVNGTRLDRPNTDYQDIEKGLILATNLPAYVKASKNPISSDAYTATGFNLHQTPSGTLLEEFSDIKLATKTGTWTTADFYGRQATALDKNFACRKGNPKLPDCTTGDLWRQARVLADSVTLLSTNFQSGFRVDGDYDLRNNAGIATVDYTLVGADDPDKPKFEIPQSLDETKNGALLGIDLDGNGKEEGSVPLDQKKIPVSLLRRFNGFFENNFVTSAYWFDNTGYPKDADADLPAASKSPGFQGSSYANNFVTPIQRRASFPEFAMEICRKIPVSECGPSDWVVGVAGETPADDTREVTAREIVTTGKYKNKVPVSQLLAGTTARPTVREEDRRYPRRVAFYRDKKNQLSPGGDLEVLGIGTPTEDILTPAASAKDDEVKVIKRYNLDSYSNTDRPRLHPTALWYQTTPDNGKTFTYDAAKPLYVKPPETMLGQPLLVPMVQIQTPFGKPSTVPLTFTGFPIGADQPSIPADGKNWLQVAKNETFNLVIAGGDTPATDTAPNGGLPNFVRLLENWQQSVPRISGGLIQFKRSTYATAPFEQTRKDTQTNNAKDLSRFGFLIDVSNTPNDLERPYRIKNSGGRSPFFMAPNNREWGFDVALLSQLPDLFSQRFTSPSLDPDEFYREVGRDDDWVKTLLCAKQGTGTFANLPLAVNSPQYRPNNCQ